MKFAWTEDGEGFFTKLDAQVAGEALEVIRKANNSNLTPESVIEASRPKKAPLHSYFEWDDAVAATGWRKEQARLLIRSVRIVVPANGEPEHKVRQYFNVKGAAGRGYQDRDTVMSMDDLKDQVIGDALKLLKQAQARVQDVKGLETAKGYMVKAEKALQGRRPASKVKEVAA